MKLLAIDGNSILNRAFYGIKILSTKNGVLTNGIFGFMNIYLKQLDIIEPDCIAVAFDMPKPTFRHKAVKTYKANRKGMPDELAQQLPIVKDILRCMGIAVIECEGFEADDILGTLAKACTNTKNKCEILTGDKDSLQLINDHVTVHLVKTKETIIFNKDKFNNEYGFDPISIIDLKALMGDTSDNISGVRGIGEKTAMNLIQKWNTIENLYQNIDNAGLTKSVYTKLIDGKKSAEQSKWLATINTDVPMDTNIKNFIPKDYDKNHLRNMLSELEMYKIIRRLDLVPDIVPDLILDPHTKTFIFNNNLINNQTEFFEKSFDEFPENTKTADFLFNNSKLTAIVKNTIYNTDEKSKILDFMKSDIKKRTFSAKNSYKYAFENNSELKNIVFDAELAGYLLNPSASDYSIEKLCKEYKTQYFSDIKSLPFLCSNLYDRLKSEKILEVLENIEMPFTEVLASMEYYGIKLDSEGVKQFGETLKDEITGLEEQIYFMAGEKFNILSPKQLGVILFEKMKLPVIKKTKTGYSTDVTVLEELSDKNPIADLILRYRQLTKLTSTYVDGLLKTVKSDGRIHSVFKQTETRTGRISSTEPNMQNIPVKTQTGRNMRKFFTADDGKILLDADYSQIELRIMAHMSDDSTMQKAFADNMDIHTITASQVFGVPENMVTSYMRSSAKAVNFGIIYGISAFSLAKDIDVSTAEAKKYIEGYFEKYPKVRKFLNKTVEDASDSGYVTTLFGRKRNIPEILSSNHMIRENGKRIAMNTPIQGTAADIIKIAMINVYKKLKAENLNAHLILQVHDELIVESSPEDSEKAGKILSECMTNACSLKVPLIADVREGKSWYDAKE